MLRTPARSGVASEGNLFGAKTEHSLHAFNLPDSFFTKKIGVAMMLINSFFEPIKFSQNLPSRSLR